MKHRNNTQKDKVDNKESSVIKNKTKRDEIGESGFSKKHPDIVVTKRDMTYILISGLMLTVAGSLIILMSLAILQFFLGFDAYAQALGTGIGVLIFGIAFLVLYIFAPNLAKKMVAIMKGKSSSTL